MPQIKVHEKALAHLSRGLYRSPASALRELVSNAWDANATRVEISTNYPNFFQITIEDNGDGFTKSDFQRLMSGGIGNSQKRPQNRKLIKNRPIIGRLGIGMLGIAQICGAFTVTSKTSSGEGFRARVHLYDLLKEKLDRDDKDVVKQAYDEQHEELKEVDVGEYDFEKFDSSTLRRGTRIIVDDVHPTFVHSFQESITHDSFKVPPLDWAKAIRIVSSVHSLQQLGHYWRLLWELAVASPIPYISKSAVPGGLISDEQKLLESYSFRLLVDGIELRKPIWLRDKKLHYSTWKVGPHTQRIYGKDLSFHGYIVVQEGLQLKPDEFRGILIRIKNVAIGYYDPSLLDYRFNEGPRSRWVTGEIFVTGGLEDALNVDRDSFNRFHPHFRALQKFIHDLLHNHVFPASYVQIEVRSKSRSEKKATKQLRHLKKVIADTVDSQVEIKTAHTTEEESKSEDAKVVISGRGKNLRIVIPSEVKTKKSNQKLAASVLAIYEVAMRESNRSRSRDIFTKLLLRLLAKW